MALCFFLKQSTPLTYYVKYKMDGAKPYSSLVAIGSKLSVLDGNLLLDASEYRSVVGVL